ncbi:ABC transporter substrate-binding protein, partial [Streptomyces griseorubiginosus]
MRDLSSSLPSPSRRGLLKGVGGAALLGAGIPLLSACGSSGSSSDPKTVSLGSNASDAVPKKAFAEIYAAFQKQSGITVDVNTKDHNTFQEQINSYLQGTPDDVFNWFAGYRMQFFAAKNLASPIDDVWAKIGGNFPDAMKKLSKGADGKYYFVPLYTYPWALFYRKSVFQQHGYQVPTTWDQLVALSKQMKKDGLVPIAFGDKDAWPAMGTFDQINFR